MRATIVAFRPQRVNRQSHLFCAIQELLCMYVTGKLQLVLPHAITQLLLVLNYTQIEAIIYTNYF